MDKQEFINRYVELCKEAGWCLCLNDTWGPDDDVDGIIELCDIREFDMSAYNRYLERMI